MKTKKSILLWMIFPILSMLAFSSCSKEGDMLDSGDMLTFKKEDPAPLVFSASYTPEQKENIKKIGYPFLPEQERNAWDDTIQSDLPTRFGLFSLPQRSTLRAAGVYGSYPGRYWTMVRVKIGKELGIRARKYLNEAVRVIEQQTNVRFYNSQRDAKYEYGIELPNVVVRTTDNNTIGSGNFGMAGDEQYIEVPRGIEDSSKYPNDKALAFFLHALCNAAGMFNEVQRLDRDDYIDIFWDNIFEDCHDFLLKETKNYSILGYFDYNSITMLSSKAYSKNGETTILKKGGGQIPETTKLSDLDKSFLNAYYLPFIARKDVYIELDSIVYIRGRQLREEERMDLQRRLNESRGLYGDPPASGRAPKRERW